MVFMASLIGSNQGRLVQEIRTNSMIFENIRLSVGRRPLPSDAKDRTAMSVYLAMIGSVLGAKPALTIKSILGRIVEDLKLDIIERIMRAPRRLSVSEKRPKRDWTAPSEIHRFSTIARMIGSKEVSSAMLAS
jgi:hypothetical protein